MIKPRSENPRRKRTGSLCILIWNTTMNQMDKIHLTTSKSSWYYLPGTKLQLIGRFYKYLSQFKDICNNLEACDQGLNKYQKHTSFLNGIKDDDFQNIKDFCDKNPFHYKCLDIKNKAIKMVNSCGLTNQSRLKTKNTTTSRNYGGDQNSALPQSVKICGFPNETYKMLSHDIRSWFGQLRKLDKSGKPIMIKYCGQ